MTALHTNNDIQHMTAVNTNTNKQGLRFFAPNTLVKALASALLLTVMGSAAQAADDQADNQSNNQVSNQTTDQSATAEAATIDMQADSVPSNQPISVLESSNGIVAIANDTPILKSQLLSAMATAQARIQASGQPMPNQQRLQNEVLNNLILRQLQLDMVKRAGIRADADVVDQSLANIAQSQGMSSLAELQQNLDARRPGSYAALRAQVAEEEALKILQQRQVSNRVRITEQDIDAFLASPEAKRLQTAEYRTIHIRIPFSDDFSRISDSEKQKAMQIAEQTQALLSTTDDVNAVLEQLSNGIAKDYATPIQGGDMGYHQASGLPTDIANQITQLDTGDITKPQVTPAGIDVVKLVDIRNVDNMIVPQWKVRHILIKNDELNNEALAEQQINDLYEQLRRDADFASLAATYSDDPGSAGRGGSLDWVTEGQMVPEFEQVMLKTPVGDFSTPFKSQFGWHILKVEDTREKDVSDTVKRNLAQEALFQRLAPQAQEDWLQELRANAFVQVFD